MFRASCAIPLVLASAFIINASYAFQQQLSKPRMLHRDQTALGVGVFDTVATTDQQIKTQILQLGAALDRGQSYNPTSGEYYSETMDVARTKIAQLLEMSPDNIPSTLEELEGEWELVLSTGE